MAATSGPTAGITLGAMDYLVPHQIRNRFYTNNGIVNPGGTIDNPGALRTASIPRSRASATAPRIPS